jgi:Leucine-rich repeat (LRR) protein
MKFKSILRKLLVEDTKLSKFKSLYNRWVLPSEKALEKNPNAKGAIDLDLFKQFILADPTSIVPGNFDIENATDKDMELVKVGSYTEWILKHFLIPNLPDEIKTLDPKSKEYKEAVQIYKGRYLEDLSKTTERLKFHNDNKQYLPIDKRDHNKLSPEEIKDIFINFKLPEKVQKKKEKSLARKTREGFKHAGGEIIYEGNNWIVIKIQDKGTVGKDAAIYYGGYKDVRNGESDWCTSSPNLNWFEKYIAKGPLYVLFPLDPSLDTTGKSEEEINQMREKELIGKRTDLPVERYQLWFDPREGQYMDRKDHRIDLIKFFNQKAPELKELFKPMFYSLLTSIDGRKLTIKFSDTNFGMYVGIYGLDDIISSAPEDLETLNVINDTNNDIQFKIPDSITRFKKLKTMALQNCVKTLPETIGDLTDLNYLSLTYNKNLESLPESIVNLPDLNFINLKNSNPNIKIPEKLSEMLDDQGNGYYYVSG